MMKRRVVLSTWPDGDRLRGCRLRQHVLDGSPSRSRRRRRRPPPAVNPFQGARFYVDPEFARMVAKRDGADARGRARG